MGARSVVPQLGGDKGGETQGALGGGSSNYEAYETREAKCVPARRDLRAEEPGPFFQANGALEGGAGVGPRGAARAPLDQHDVVPIGRAVRVGRQSEQVGGIR